MDNEWKELDVWNLPPDILKMGEYEVECTSPENMADDEDPDMLQDESLTGGWLEEEDDIINLLEWLREYPNQDLLFYRYRRKQKPMPTHEEILKPRFWYNGTSWESIKACICCDGVWKYNINTHFGQNDWAVAAWFAGRESADVPGVA